MPRLFLVDPGAPGVVLEAYDAIDGTRAADVRLREVQVAGDALLPQDAARAAQPGPLQQVLAEGVIADAWYAVGVMRAAFWQTARYVQQREQFGKPLSSLQVVQHRIAEMAVACADALATCEVAALRVESDPYGSVDAACMARSKILRASRAVGQQCVQLHGAMGVCEELSIAASFRALSAFWHGESEPDGYAAAFGRSLIERAGHGRSLLAGPTAQSQEAAWI